jgi:hypothetical protein
LVPPAYLLWENRPLVKIIPYSLIQVRTLITFGLEYSGNEIEYIWRFSQDEPYINCPAIFFNVNIILRLKWDYMWIKCVKTRNNC